MENQTPIPQDDPISNAIGVLAFLRSVIRCGEDLSEQEYEVVQKTIDALKQIQPNKQVLPTAINP